MRLGNTFIFVLLTLILGGLITSGVVSAEERNPPFPSYGSGPVEVRLYTDYFCPPCRAMEPAVEPLLKDLLKKNAIRLTLVCGNRNFEGGITMAWLTGYPREQIDWFPTIDPQKCVKCGMCMNCGKAVYDWAEDSPRVGRPNSCIVGCSTCANLCMGKAISFPDIEGVRAIYKKEHLWAKVKKQLKAEGKLKAEQG